jgi:hypothetical protein
MFYLEYGPKGKFIADLMHYNKSGLYTIFLLRQVKRQLKAVESGLRNDLVNLLGYCLGHISHVAADITVHPYVNSIVAAYPDNEADKFNDNQRWQTAPNIWKFHNVLEHYQDAYVLHRRFYGQEGFQKDWESVNVAAAAARYLQQSSAKKYWFLVKGARDFYRFKKPFDAALEEDKYKFFTSNNWIIDVNSYYKSSIPSFKTMDACPKLVQGGRYDSGGKLASAGLFDRYIDRAVAQTKAFWREVERYLAAPQTDFSDEEMLVDKRSFPTLRRHWNLDCGLAPTASSMVRAWDVPEKADTRLHLSGRIELRPPSGAARIDDVKL